MHVFVVLRVIIIKDKLKNLYVMRTIITFIMFMAAAYAAMAQNGTQDRKLSKKERKLMEARIDSALNAEAVQAINDTAFTIEADKVEFKRGYTAHVTASTNFVAVSGSNSIVQVAFNVPVSGFNGLGGITLEGIVTGYKISSDKKGNTYVKLSVSGKGISAQLFISLWKDANKATVSIQPNFNSNKLTLSGMLWKPERSNIFKGTTF